MPRSYKLDLDAYIIWILVFGFWCCFRALSARDWTLPLNLSFEITWPRSERALVQVHFRDADSSRSTACAHAGDALGLFTRPFSLSRQLPDGPLDSQARRLCHFGCGYAASHSRNTFKSFCIFAIMGLPSPWSYS